MKKHILTILLFTTSLFCMSQGYGFVIFSITGDTVITRTSFGDLGKKDTITTCFVIKAKSENGLKNISIIKIDEKKSLKHNIGYACADYTAIPYDTLSKYKLKHTGVIRKDLNEKIVLQSKVIEKATEIINGKKIKKKLYQHTFSMNGSVFFVDTSWIIKNKETSIKPKIYRVYYNEQIDAYYIEYSICSNNYDVVKKLVISNYTSKEIIK